MAQRRRRGAQPGNQNARRHGFYARHLDAAQTDDLEIARRLPPDRLDDEIALLRARLNAVLDTAPSRFDLVLAGLRTLAQLIAIRHRLSPERANDLADHVAGLLRGVAVQLYPEGAPDPDDP